jgi:hypothetical protein
VVVIRVVGHVLFARHGAFESFHKLIVLLGSRDRVEVRSGVDDGRCHI